MECGKTRLAEAHSWPSEHSVDQADTGLRRQAASFWRGVLCLFQELKMRVVKKAVKVALVAGVVGIGLHAVSRKLKLPSRIADFAHSVEGVPFPGTKLYSFLAAREFVGMYKAIADDILTADHFERILDVGTGVGYLPIELAQKDREISIVGIDQSPEMTRIANANAHAFRVDKAVQLVTGDPANLPFPGRYFDLVVAVLVLHHWKDPSAVFEEVFHVLKPGGQFWIYDYRKNVPEEIWDTLRSKLSWLQKTLLLFGPIPSSKAAYEKEQVLALAKRFHFEEIETEEIALPLFEKAMPVFNRFMFRKPQISEHK
ncbi:MAG: class I SAM-dependent methyltransferase [Armatimonadetes bacterium]|nr:class I SAM-dependent methyltransferase [Armatimonadota bacterium]